jgi:hypothetical protein
MDRVLGIDPVAALIIGASGAWIAGSLVIRRLRLRNGRSWPTTDGVIQNADVREHRTRSAQWFVAEVPYSYQVNGKLYFGRFTKTFDYETDAREYKERLWGKRIVVRFNPRRIERSLFTAKDAAEL